jgi:type IV conjugative transfer system coupling protein TraD
MSIVRGSELFKHNAVMTAGTLSGALISAVMAVLLWLRWDGDLLAFWRTPQWEIYWTTLVAKAYIAVGLSHGVLSMPTEGGVEHWPVTDIVTNQGVMDIANTVERWLAQRGLECLLISFLGGGVWFGAAGWYGHAKGRNQQVAGVGLTRKSLFWARQCFTFWLWSRYAVGGVHLPKSGETLYILIVGTIGTGKTTAILDLLDQIRRRGDAAIVIDPDGSFIARFYRADHDIILNPNDARMPAWTPWADCLEQKHFYDLADGLMAREPGDQSDSIWEIGAAQLISSALQALKRDGQCTNAQLYRFFAELPLRDIEERLQGLPAGVVMNTAIERTALSVRFTAMKRAAALQHLHDGDGGEAFSIRKFVQNPGGRWLFLSAPADMRAMLRPLLTVWLHLATTALLTMSPSPTRRVWFVIDEAAALNRIPSLPSLMQEGRRFGACVVLGFQSLSQLIAIYGKPEATTILAIPQTTLALRTPDPETAELLAKRLGEEVFIETKESVQYGGHPARDGVSLSQQYTKRSVVEPAALQSLPDRTGYLRLPGPLPLVRVKLNVRRRKTIAPAFVPREASHETSSTIHPTEKTPQATSGGKEKEDDRGLSGLAQDLAEPDGE